MRTWFVTNKARAEARTAYEAGKMAAGSMSESVDRFIDRRFQPQVKGYLNVLERQFFKCLNPTTAPPVTLALIEDNIFVDNVGRLKEKMNDRRDETVA